MFSLQSLPAWRVRGRSPTHLYLAPHRLLCDCVAHYTLLLPDVALVPPSLVLVPDASGCLVLSNALSGPECVFWGPTTQTVEVQNDQSQPGSLFFVEFLPGGARRLLGRSMEELADLRLPLSQLDRALCQGILAAIERNTALSSFLDALDLLLLTHAAALESSSEQTLLRLPFSPSLFTVGDLARATFYSERQLSRLLTPSLGMGVKRYLRLLRINRAVALLGDSALSLTALSQELGYFDQSHFIYDFKTVCRLSPGGYRQQMSDFYNEPYKF